MYQIHLSMKDLQKVRDAAQLIIDRI